MKLWERHLFSRLIKTMGFVLSGLFLIYFLVDLSIHSVRFFSGKANCLSILLYYLHCFSMHLDFFFALAFLLSTLRVLFDLMQHSECIALQMAGLSHRRLMRPLWVIASLLALFSYANAEWIAPFALGSMQQFRDEVAKKKKQVLREHVHDVTLDDGSAIIYERFDFQSKTLFDVYWISGTHRFWHMKMLHLTTPIQGYFVDRFERNDTGSIEVTESFPERSFPELPLLASQALQKFTPFENRSLSVLFLQSLSSNTDRQMIRAHLHYKLSKPLLSLLIAFILSPILLRFSRQSRAFLITACSLFSLLSFLTILDGFLILAENGVLAPSIALWIPWLLGIGAAFRKA